MMRRKRKKKGRGIEVKWRLVFPASTASRTPPNSSLVCSGLGDMAAGLGLDCRNISGVEESGIAGKDNENRRKKGRRRKGKDERRAKGKGWTFKDLTSQHIHTLVHFTLL